MAGKFLPQEFAILTGTPARMRGVLLLNQVQNVSVMENPALR
jgi:hypothetical protein